MGPVAGEAVVRAAGTVRRTRREAPMRVMTAALMIGPEREVVPHT